MIFSDIKDGFKVIWTNVQLKGLITLETLDDFFGTNIFVFLPVLASEILKVGPGEYGIMQTMLGAGSFVTALVLSSIKEINEVRSTNVILGFVRSIPGFSWYS